MCHCIHCPCTAALLLSVTSLTVAVLAWVVMIAQEKF